MHRILIAEDDRVLAEVLRFKVDQAGYEVVVANDGLSAADHARTQKFDLIISDHQMPGMTGFEFCRIVRQTPPNAETPIFYCSAKSYEIDTEQLGRELRASRIFLKPFSPRELVQAIAETLNAPADHAALLSAKPASRG